MPDPNLPQGGAIKDHSQVSLPAELTSFLENRDGQWGLIGNVDGRQTFTPLDIVVAQTQKFDAADSRLAEASRVLKSNRSKLDLAEKVIKSFNGDDDAAREVMEYFGEEVDAPTGDAPTALQPAAQPTGQPMQYQLPPDLQAFIKDWQDIKANYGDPRQIMGLAVSQATESVRADVKSRVRATVLGNPDFKKFLKGKGPDTVNAYVDEVFETVDRAIKRGAPDGAPTYVQAIRETASKLAKFGVAGESSHTPSPEEVVRRSLGLGPSAGSGAFGSSEIVTSGKRPEATTPIGARPGDHARNLFARLQYDAAQKVQEQGASE